MAEIRPNNRVTMSDSFVKSICAYLEALMMISLRWSFGVTPFVQSLWRLRSILLRSTNISRWGSLSFFHAYLINCFFLFALSSGNSLLASGSAVRVKKR